MNHHPFVNWIRVVIPNYNQLVVFFLFLSLFYFCQIFFYLLFLLMQKDWQLAQSFVENMHRESRWGILSYATTVFALYGMLRAAQFLPNWHPQYFTWLINTPWTNNKPLPFGSINFLPQDCLIILAASMYMRPVVQADFLYLPIAAMSGYLIVLMISFLLVEQWVDFFIPAYGSGVAILVLSLAPWWAAYILFVLLYFSGISGIQRMLKRNANRKLLSDRFQPFIPIRPQGQQNNSGTSKNKEPAAGWPFTALASTPLLQTRNKTREIVWAILMGWIYYAIFSACYFSPYTTELGWLDALKTATFLKNAMPILLILFTIFRPISEGFLPPISLLGRVRTGHLIIPKYDHIFLPALTCLGSIVLVNSLLTIAQVPVLLSGTLSNILPTIVLIYSNPDYERWRLTASCRMIHIPGANNQKRIQQMRANHQ